MIDRLRAWMQAALGRLTHQTLTGRDWLIVVVATVIALLLSAALIWRQDILQSTLDPKEPFQTYHPPNAPDYAKPSAWALLPRRDAAATPAPHRDAIAGFASRLQVEDCLRRLETAGNGQPYAIIALRPRVFDDLLHTGDTPLGNDIIAEFGRRVTDATRLRDVRGCWDDSTFVCVLEQDATRASIQQLCAGLAERLKFPFQSKAWSFAVEAEIGSATFAAGDGTAIAALGLAVDAIGRAAGTASSGLSASAAESSTTPVSDPMPASPANLPPFSSGQVPAGLAERVTERRMASRHRVLKRGRIGINNLHSTIDCTVRNLSEQGALLRIEGFFAAPRRFHLSIGDDFKRDVWLRWQNGSEAGVSFTPIEEPSAQA